MLATALSQSSISDCSNASAEITTQSKPSEGILASSNGCLKKPGAALKVTYRPAGIWTFPSAFALIASSEDDEGDFWYSTSPRECWLVNSNVLCFLAEASKLRWKYLVSWSAQHGCGAQKRNRLIRMVNALSKKFIAVTSTPVQRIGVTRKRRGQAYDRSRWRPQSASSSVANQWRK